MVYRTFFFYVIHINKIFTVKELLNDIAIINIFFPYTLDTSFSSALLKMSIFKLRIRFNVSITEQHVYEIQCTFDSIKFILSVR